MWKLLRVIVATTILNLAVPWLAHGAGLMERPTGSAGEDAKTARRLIPLARRGNPSAETALGFLYANGLGVPQSYDAAVDLYLRAAEQGDSRAQYLLGLMYDKGFGVERNDILAHKWLNLAAGGASGHDREKFIKIRNAVAFKMSQVDIIAAQRLALEWVPKPRR